MLKELQLFDLHSHTACEHAVALNISRYLTCQFLVKLNFWPPTVASYINPPLVMV